MTRDSHTRTKGVLRVEQLEDRSVPATGPFTPNNFGGGIFTPFDAFSGQVNAASGDVTGDGVPDIIVAQGLGSGSASEVRVFDGAAARGQRTAVLISDFFAYSDSPGASPNPGFAGGVFVAAADFNGDGAAEVVTSTGAGGQGHLKVFTFRNQFGQFLGNAPILQTSFYAYPGFLGDIRVATAQRAGLPPLLITASGAGTTEADIRIYSNPLGIGSTAPGAFVPPDAQTFVFPGYLGGVSIATGDTNLDGFDELFVAPITGTPVVSVFSLVPPNTGTFAFGNVLTGPSTAIGFFPLITFATSQVPQPDIRLGSADVNGDGRKDILVSFVTPSFNSPISVFSLNPGAVSVSQLPSISGFQGFGFFGFVNGSWLASSTFTAPGGITGGAGTFVIPATTAFATTGANTSLTFGTTTATPTTTTGTGLRF